MAAPAGQTWALFGAGVRAVLEAWPALRMAVENGFGGAHSREKARWLGAVVQDYFAQNADLEAEEVEFFLSDIMSAEFDTLVEDGSLAQVSRQLQAMFRYFQSGEEPLLRHCIGQVALEPAQGTAMEAWAGPRTHHHDQEDEGVDGAAEQMEVTDTDSRDAPAQPWASQAGPSAATSSGATAASVGQEAADEGWIVIPRKKK